MPRPVPIALLAALALSACAHATRPAEAPSPVTPAVAAPGPWAAELEAFARQDREHPFPPGGVVFVGSSSIRLWSTLEADMAPLPVLNRGFGGSRLLDAVEHADRLVSKHAPSVVVVFSGTNDLAGTEPGTPEEVRDLFRRLVARLRAADSRLAIAYIAITPTLAREEHLPAVRAANRLIRLDCEADPRLEFIDPTPELADERGRPDPACFQGDRLHLNARGYAVWTRHVRPVVERLVAREAPPGGEPSSRMPTGRPGSGASPRAPAASPRTRP